MPTHTVARVTVTAYCLGRPACRTCGTRGRTRLGSRSGHGLAAAAASGRRRLFPLRSRVYVPGYGLAQVDDTGGGVRARQLDARFPTHAQARRWGKRVLTVRVTVPRKGR
jgi:3D (Asp-Asp-Asp) domain-containing protein